MALVALRHDGIEPAGSDVEQLSWLAFGNGRVGDRMQWREFVRSGAQQPVVDDRWNSAGQWFGGGGLFCVADNQYFHWSSDAAAGSAAGVARDVDFLRRGGR